jgi:hypothetical protein
MNLFPSSWEQKIAITIYQTAQRHSNIPDMELNFVGGLYLATVPGAPVLQSDHGTVGRSGESEQQDAPPELPNHGSHDTVVTHKAATGNTKPVHCM